MMDVVMSALKSRKITVLFVEHDMEIVARFADRVLAFYDGTVIADGTPAAALADPQGADPHQRHQAGTSRGQPMLRVSDLDVSIGPVPVIREASLDLRRGRDVRSHRPQRRRQDHVPARADGGDPGDRQGRAWRRRPAGAAAASPRRLRDRLHARGPPPGARLHGRTEHPLAQLDDARPTGSSSGCNGSSRSCPRSRRFAPRSSLELSGGQQKMVALARALMAGTPHAAARRAVRGAGAGARAPARRGDGQPEGTSGFRS